MGVLAALAAVPRRLHGLPADAPAALHLPRGRQRAVRGTVGGGVRYRLVTELGYGRRTGTRVT